VALPRLRPALYPTRGAPPGQRGDHASGLTTVGGEYAERVCGSVGRVFPLRPFFFPTKPKTSARQNGSGERPLRPRPSPATLCFPPADELKQKSPRAIAVCVPACSIGSQSIHQTRGRAVRSDTTLHGAGRSRVSRSAQIPRDNVLFLSLVCPIASSKRGGRHHVLPDLTRGPETNRETTAPPNPVFPDHGHPLHQWHCSSDRLVP